MLTKEDIILMYIEDMKEFPINFSYQLMLGNVPRSNDILNLLCEIENSCLLFWYTYNKYGLESVPIKALDIIKKDPKWFSHYKNELKKIEFEKKFYDNERAPVPCLRKKI